MCMIEAILKKSLFFSFKVEVMSIYFSKYYRDGIWNHDVFLLFLDFGVNNSDLIISMRFIKQKRYWRLHQRSWWDRSVHCNLTARYQPTVLLVDHHWWSDGRPTAQPRQQHGMHTEANAGREPLAAKGCSSPRAAVHFESSLKIPEEQQPQKKSHWSWTAHPVLNVQSVSCLILLF